MNGNDASYSDLERARRLSQSLVDPDSAGADPPPPAPGRAPRFSATVAVQRGQELAAARPANGSGDPHDYGPGAWHSLLDACLAAVGAEAAFALSANGLLIAMRGSGDAEELEPLGARLLAMMDQAERIEQAGTQRASVVIHLGERWLEGVRLAGDEELAVGILCRRPLGERDWQRLEPLLELEGSHTSA